MKKAPAEKKYLDIWTAEVTGEDSLSRDGLDLYTEGKLRDILKFTYENSIFYREMLGNCDLFPGILELEGRGFMDAFGRLPMTSSDDLRARGMDLLCVRPGDISRIVTLDTGGTTGKPKRIYFTHEDQQLTVDYFGNGMQLIVDDTDCVMILMPAQIPGSIGKLLSEGLQNFGVRVIEYGLPGFFPGLDGRCDDGEVDEIIDIMKREGVTSVVALPTHMRAVAETAGGSLSLHSMLLSAEYVPEEDVMLFEESFGCRVYEHYGMTEMGLGCAVSCGHGAGYHIREADLYIEIIDPETGRVIHDDTPGEVVFTTLTRKGMPFIRYRTGDMSRWITEPCPCGSVLKRLARVNDRNEVKGYLR